MNKNLKLSKDQVFCEGILNVVFPSLRSFTKSIHDNDNLKGWLFRGHYSSRWELETSLQRTMEKKRVNFGTRHLNRFRMYSRGLLKYDYFLQASDDEIWAIGQHYGLKTPLLDWTASPLVALFFAFEEEVYSIDKSKFPIDEKAEAYLKKLNKVPEDYRAVYFLNVDRIKELFYKIVANELFLLDKHAAKNAKIINAAKESGMNFEEFVGRLVELSIEKRKGETLPPFFKQAYKQAEMMFIRVVSPLSGENRRLLSQRGLFTKTYSPHSIDKIIKNSFPKENLLVKAFIPTHLRSEILSFLDTANINYMSLFPDLLGAAKYSNVKYSSAINTGEIDTHTDILQELFQ